MGVIALALFANGSIDHFYIPTWVKVTAGLAIAAGTYVGGWRIMRTLGQRLYKIEPAAGFSAQTCAGAMIYLATHLGYPLSTTHVISGAVLGAGSTSGFSAVRWGIAGNIVVAWFLTIPRPRSSPRRSTGRSRRSSRRTFTAPSPGRRPRSGRPGRGARITSTERVLALDLLQRLLRRDEHGLRQRREEQLRPELLARVG